LITVLMAFSPILFICGFIFTFLAIFRDYGASDQGKDQELFNQRLYKRLSLLLTPIFICAPWSVELFVNPKRFFIDAGFLFPGGGPNLALAGNPGGPGSLPVYLVSPLTIVLAISLFSSTRARFVAELGFIALLSAVLLSAISITGNGTSVQTPIYAGTLLTAATLAAVSAAVIMLDKLRERLVTTNINFRHISAAALLIVTTLYTMASISWLVTTGANSPLQTGKEIALPPFLAIESDAKTLVIRPRTVGEDVSLNYYLARGGDSQIAQPDMAPPDSVQISSAVKELADGSGVTASSTFAVNGIKYLFLKSPVDQNFVRVVDGLGGFTRTSSTKAGIVWKVSVNTAQFIFTDVAGNRSVLSQGKLGISVSAPGTLTVTENYSQGWRAIQDGSRLERTRSVDGAPIFTVVKPGLVNVIFDGTSRRAWISVQVVIFITVLVLALPAGRRRREIEDAELA